MTREVGLYGTVLERVRRLSDQVGDCWEWRGFVETDGRVPIIKVGGRHTPVRRAVAVATGRLEPISKNRAVPKCHNWRCVNPAHVIVVTHSDANKRARMQLDQAQPFLCRKIALARRQTSKLTSEIAREIREAEGSITLISAQYKISRSTVSDIKTGRIWRDYSNPFYNLVQAVTNKVRDASL